jgi:hypothetical protein
MPETSYCEAPGCERETRESRTYCDTHQKQKQRTGKVGAIEQRLSPKERLEEAALAYGLAEEDDEFNEARRVLFKAARTLGPSLAHGELVRQGQAAARRRGVHVGRRPTLAVAEAVSAVARLGSASRAAEALKVSPRTVQRALRRASEVVVLSQTLAA